jgi:hypothetical protein
VAWVERFEKTACDRNLETRRYGQSSVITTVPGPAGPLADSGNASDFQQRGGNRRRVIALQASPGTRIFIGCTFAVSPVDTITMPCGRKRKRHKIATHKRKKRLRKNRHKKKPR